MRIRRNLTGEDRLKIIELSKKNKVIDINKIAKEGPWSTTTVRNVLTDYHNDRIDARGNIKGKFIKTKNSIATVFTNPVVFEKM